MNITKIIGQKLGIVKKDAVTHKLKWKIPEQRISCPVENPNDIVLVMEKKLKAKFLGGGHFSDVVHVKEYGQEIFSYIFVRTDLRNEEETVVADGYMIQEDGVKLGFDVSSANTMDENLSAMGYSSVFERRYNVWRFGYYNSIVSIFEIEQFGSFVEISLPATNFEKSRENDSKIADKLLEHLTIREEDVLATDVTTLQLLSTMQESKKK